ncbi:MAG: hypothetical protein JJ974_00985 [Phycisphaerales bacterium]|nr:hypothetical protein [Phycisphaerales bacterium]
MDATYLTSTPLTLAQSLPEGGSISLFFLLAGGMMLWLFGAKIVKPVFFIFGLAIGGFVGTTILPLTGLPAFDLGGFTLTPGFTGLIAGSIIGALVMLAMFRMVITITAAIAFAAAGLLGAMVFLHFNPTQSTTLTETETAIVDSGDQGINALNSATDSIAQEAAERSVDILNSGDEPLIGEEAKQDILDAAQRSREFISRVVENVRADLDARPARDKMIAFSSMFAGLALGLLIGVVMPNRAAALVTSLTGSAAWIAAGTALLTARNGEIPSFLDHSAVVWAVIWIFITILGLFVQLGFLDKKSQRTARAQDRDDDDDES